jgi:hypothetical protein
MVSNAYHISCPQPDFTTNELICIGQIMIDDEITNVFWWNRTFQVIISHRNEWFIENNCSIQTTLNNICNLRDFVITNMRVSDRIISNPEPIVYELWSQLFYHGLSIQFNVVDRNSYIENFYSNQVYQ